MKPVLPAEPCQGVQLHSPPTIFSAACQGFVVHVKAAGSQGSLRLIAARQGDVRQLVEAGEPEVAEPVVAECHCCR